MVLLTIDAWRADFADAFEGVPLLPSLAAYPTARLDRLWANAAWTAPALASVFTGAHVLHHDVHFAWSRLRHDFMGLAAVFWSHGYHTPGICYLLNGREYFQHLGFCPEFTPVCPESPDDPILLDAIDRAATQREPSFLWYHYRFVHLPYWAPDRFRRTFGIEAVPERLRRAVGIHAEAPRHRVSLDEEDAPVLRRMYAAGVLRMDAWLATVLDRIQSVGLDATVVITADHGDELLEHGHVGHASTAYDGKLFDEVLRIPCFVLDSRITESRVVSDRAEGRDLYATMLGLAGLPAPSSGAIDFSAALLRGASPDADPRRIFCAHTPAWGSKTRPSMMHEGRTALFDDRWKYLKTPDEECLYDLTVDPGERHPIRDEPRLVPWRTRLEHERSWP